LFCEGIFKAAFFLAGQPGLDANSKAIMPKKHGSFGFGDQN
jgi:hypothetical protein